MQPTYEVFAVSAHALPSFGREGGRAFGAVLKSPDLSLAQLTFVGVHPWSDGCKASLRPLPAGGGRGEVLSVAVAPVDKSFTFGAFAVQELPKRPWDVVPVVRDSGVDIVAFRRQQVRGGRGCRRECRLEAGQSTQHAP